MRRPRSPSAGRAPTCSSSSTSVPASASAWTWSATKPCSTGGWNARASGSKPAKSEHPAGPTPGSPREWNVPVARGAGAGRRRPSAAGSDEPLDEGEGGVAHLAPAGVDRQRVTTAGHLDDLGDGVLVADLLLVR